MDGKYFLLHKTLSTRLWVVRVFASAVLVVHDAGMLYVCIYNEVRVIVYQGITI